MTHVPFFFSVYRCRTQANPIDFVSCVVEKFPLESITLIATGLDTS